MGVQLEEGGATKRPVAIGDRIGRFEIIGALGAGGMGDLYRARDPQLLRDVAIKLLPAALTHDPDRRRRFEQEARATASLNHPNVVAVYDTGVHQGLGFIVTELLEGETLRERMKGRPLPARKAVEYAAQIAEGLAAGHERGIVHRDVKPENLFITKTGNVKILDFGLAKVIDHGASSTATATIEVDGVALGPVIGTAAYMSPEQARGLRVDHRSDIFTLGVVLYEMLAGFAPSRRDTTADTLSAILHEDPPELRAAPPALERVVRRCLEKAPEQRFQNARDLGFDLEAVFPFQLTSARSVSRVLVSRAGVSMLLAVVALAAAAALGYRTGQSTSPPAATREPYKARRFTDLSGIEETPAISPDNSTVAYVARVDGRRQLFVRSLAGGWPVQVTSDAADHEFPRWSPDGSSLFYFSPSAPREVQGAIWSVGYLGGSPRRVIDSISGADVSRDGRLATFRLEGERVQLMTSSLTGTDVREFASSVAGYHRYPRWSPDGRSIAFQRGDGLRFDIFVASELGGEPRPLTTDRNIINGLAWRPDGGAIVYASSRDSTIPYLPPQTLWEVPLNGDAPRRLTSTDQWYEEPDIHSESGLVAVVRMRMDFSILRLPFSLDAAANVRDAEGIIRQSAQVSTPTEAPGGAIAFLSDSGGRGNLWVRSPGSSDPRQITFEDDPAVAVGVPIFAPNGRSIAFVSSKGRTGFDFGLWLVYPDGANLRNVAPYGLGMAWSADSQWLYYAETSAGALNKVAASGGEPVRVRDEPTRNVIGLHGATLYYVVEHPLLDGRPEFEIKVATPEGGPARTLGRIPASRVPRWQIVNPALSPDGAWLAMPLTDGSTTNIWALSTTTDEWRPVTDFGERTTFIARRVSWSPDGSSILAAVGEGDADVVLLDGLISAR